MQLESTNKGRRPGGRTADTGRRVFDAALALLVEGGMTACTFQTVAQRSGVSRTTLYRRWPDRAALVLDALADRVEHDIVAPDTGSLAGDLRSLLRQVAAFLATPLGRAALVAAAESDSPEEMRSDFWTLRMATMAPLFARARRRGELSQTDDAEAILASTVGAVYFRLLVGGRPADDDWIVRIVDRAVATAPR